MSAPQPADRSHQRASDADRLRVAQLLSDAAAIGRLDMNELDDRLGLVYAAKTYGELERVRDDIPDVPETFAAPMVGVPERTSSFIAIMSSFKRTGRWRVAARNTAVAFWGGGKLDLRYAEFSGRDITIRCVAIMGGVEIVLPPEVSADIRGVGLMGGFDDSATGLGASGAPRVTVTGLAFWGGVEVRRAPRKTGDLTA